MISKGHKQKTLKQSLKIHSKDIQLISQQGAKNRVLQYTQFKRREREKKGTQNRQDREKTISKMVDLQQTINS